MHKSISSFCSQEDNRICSIPVLDKIISMIYKTSIKYSHYQLQDIVVSDIFGDNNIYHYHNLKLLDHLYHQNINDVRNCLKENYPNIHFIFYYNEDLEDSEIVLDISRIYIIYNHYNEITNIIGIDSRCNHTYNLI